MGRKIILIAIVLMTAACGDRAKVEQMRPTEYFVDNQWLACERVPAVDPTCGATLQCVNKTYTCQKQLIPRGEMEPK